MSISRKELFQGLKKQLEEKREIETEREKRHIQYTKKVKDELPREVNKLIDMFHSACESPLEVEVKEKSVGLRWAYEGKSAGEVIVKYLKIKFMDRFIELDLHPDLGYIGATAKIDFKTNAPGIRSKLPFMDRQGFFIKIGYTADEPNRVFFITDKANKSFDVTEETVLEVLKAVFSDE